MALEMVILEMALPGFIILNFIYQPGCLLNPTSGGRVGPFWAISSGDGPTIHTRVYILIHTRDAGS